MPARPRTHAWFKGLQGLDQGIPMRGRCGDREASARGYWYRDIGDRRTPTGSSQPVDTRRHPSAPADQGVHPRRRDLNAPPLRSPKTPHAPSISMVGGVIDLGGRGLFSAKLAKPGQVRTRSVQALRSAEHTHSPGGGCRLPDRSAARGDVGGGVPQPTGSSTAGRPTQDPWKRLRAWPEKSARVGARPHSGGTPQRCVHPQNFRTDHNPAIRNNAS